MNLSLASLASLLITATNPSPTLEAPAVDGRVVTLDEALEHLGSNNLDARLAKATLEKSLVISKKAWSVLLPTINASGTLTRNNVGADFTMVVPRIDPRTDLIDVGIEPYVFRGSIQKVWQQRAGVDFRWTLLSGKAIPTIRAAYAALDYDQLTFEQTLQTLRLATTLAYYQAVNAKEVLAIRTRAIESSREQLRLAQARVAVGGASKVEVLRAQAEIAQAQQLAVAAQNAAQLAHLALATMIGLLQPDGSAQTFEVRSPTFGTPSAPKPIGESDLDLRLDLQRSELQLEIADYNEDLTFARFFPSLVASGNYGVSNVRGFTGRYEAWQINLTLEWQLFEGGLTYFTWQERGIDIEQATVARDKARQDARKQLVEAKLNVDNALAATEASLTAESLAKESAYLVRTQYELGDATQLELQEADRVMANAETDAALARLNLAIAMATLEHVKRAPPPDAKPVTIAPSLTDQMQGAILGAR